MAEKVDLEKCNFGNFKRPVTLTLTWTLDQVILHTVTHHSSTSIYTLNFTEIGKLSVDGRTDGRTYVLTDGHFPSNVIRSTWTSRPKKGNVPPVKWNAEIHFCDFDLRVRKSQAAKVPGNEMASEQIGLADSLQEANWPGSESSVPWHIMQQLQSVVTNVPIMRSKLL